MRSEKIAMSEKGGTRAGAGRPSTGGRMHEVCLGKGTDTKQACNCLKDAKKIYSAQVPLPHKATVPI